MLPLERISVRKVRRKLAEDGMRAMVVSAAEFSARWIILTPIINYGIENDWIQTRTFVDVPGAVSPAGEQIANKHAVEVPDGYIFPSTGLVTDQSGQLLLESISSPTADTSYKAVPIVHHLFRDGPQITLSIVRNDKNKFRQWATRAKVISPLIPRYTNYFHWLIETLPRIRHIETYREMTGTKPTLIVPHDPSSWMIESLKLVIDDRFKIQPASTRIYQAKRTIATTRAGITFSDCNWLRQRVLDRVSPDLDSRNRIYISRANARDRRVVNEDELIEKLEYFGFESYALEELSVAEQAELFAGADFVVGPHGAGFSNLVFSDQAAVIELFGSNIKSNFNKLSDVRGLEYESIECTPQGTDIQVDVDQVCEAITARDL